MNDDTTTSADERRNRDAQSWLQLMIARQDVMPGQERTVNGLRNELAALRRQARQRGWSTPAPTTSRAPG